MDNKFGKTLKEIRVNQRLTLKRLSEFTGKSIGYLSDIEQGRKQPPKKELAEKIERALGLSTGAIVDLAEEVRQLPKMISREIKSKPRLSQVLLRADEDLTDEEFENVMKHIAELQKGE